MVFFVKPNRDIQTSTGIIFQPMRINGIKWMKTTNDKYFSYNISGGCDYKKRTEWGGKLNGPQKLQEGRRLESFSYPDQLVFEIIGFGGPICKRSPIRSRRRATVFSLVSAPGDKVDVAHGP